MGEVRVASDRYWGAQTQRSLQNFRIGGERMPLPIVRAFAVLKKAAALTNAELGVLSAEKASDDRRGLRRDPGRHPRRPLPAGRLADRLRHADEHERQRGRQPTAPSRWSAARSAARSRSTPTTTSTSRSRSNDTFPTRDAHRRLRRGRRPPAAASCASSTTRSTPRREAFDDVVKIGRTHLMDATPVTLGQEFSGYAAQVRKGIAAVEHTPAAPAPSWRSAAPPSAPASTRPRASPSAWPRRSPS